MFALCIITNKRTAHVASYFLFWSALILLLVQIILPLTLYARVQNSLDGISKIEVPSNNSQSSGVQSYSCRKPDPSWEEVLSKREEFSKTYAIPIEPTKVKDKALSPEKNPESFTFRSCISTEPLNFKDSGIMEPISSDIRPVQDFVDLKNPPEGYDLVSGPNSFRVYFSSVSPTFWYKSEHDSVHLTRITVGGVPLEKLKEKAKIHNSTIVYENILSDVDLVFSVTSTGLTKQFILKNNKALDHDWKTIDFQIESSQLFQRDSNISEVAQKSMTVDKTTWESSKQVVRSGQSDLGNISNEQLEKLLVYSTPNTQNSKENLPTRSFVTQSVKSMDKTSNNQEIQAGTLLWSLQSDMELSKENKVTKVTVTNNSINPQKVDVNLTLKKQSKTFSVSDSVQIPQPFLFDGKGVYISQVSSQLLGNTLRLYPDTTDLYNPTRTFPLIIDPGITPIKHPTGDAFVRKNTPQLPQGSFNYWFLSVGGDFLDTTTSSDLDTTRTLLEYKLPAHITQGVQIGSAQLSVMRYNTFASGFVADVYGLDNDFDEQSVTWENQPKMNQKYGQIDFQGMVNSSQNDGGQFSVSTDISELIRNSVSQSKDKIGIGIKDSDESRFRGVAFCSKDYISNHPCNEKDDSPYLEITYNNTPTPPTLMIADKTQVIGKCNLSGSQSTGICDPHSSYEYSISNINDGEHIASDHDNKAYVNWFGKPQGLQVLDSTHELSGWKGPTYGTQNFQANIGDGWYDTWARNMDEFKAQSADSNHAHILFDHLPPGFISNAQDFKTYQNNNQINIHPHFVDNLDAPATLQVEPRGQGSVFLTNLESGLHLDFGLSKSQGIPVSYKKSNGFLVQLWNPHAQYNQLWHWDALTGTISIDSQKCLLASDDDTNVLLSDRCSDSKAAWDYLQSGQIQLRNSEKCIANGEYNLYGGKTVLLVSCNLSDMSQLWRQEGQTRMISQSPKHNEQNSAYLQLNEKNEDLALKFAFSDTGKIQVIGTTLSFAGCLDSESRSNGSQVMVDECENDQNQIWEITSIGQIQLKNTSLCIDYPQDPSQNILLLSCHVGANQRWNWVVQSMKTISTEAGMHLDLKNGEMQSGVAVQTYSKNSTQSQRFKYDQSKFIITQNNLCLDGDSGQAGAAVYMWTCHGTKNQEWYNLPTGQLMNGVGNCLEDSHPNQSGSVLILQGCNTNKLSQRFSIDAANLDNLYWPDRKLVSKVNVVNQETHQTRQGDWQDGVSQFGNLQDGLYEVNAMAKDAIGDESNVSAQHNLGIVTIDSTIPKVTKLSLDNQRLSHNKNDKFKVGQLSAAVKDNNLDRIEAHIIDAKTHSLKNIIKTCLIGSSQKSCDRTNWKTDKDGNVPVSFLISDRDQLGADLADGVYEIQIVALDRAGNFNDTQDVSSWTEFVVDNSPALISISSPSNNYWTHDSSLKIYGYLGGYNVEGNQDRDTDGLQVRVQGPGDVDKGIFSNEGIALTSQNPLLSVEHVTIPNNDNLGKFFVYSRLLNEPGIYTFEFKSNDLVKNETTQIGSESRSPAMTWTVGYDPVSPSLHVSKEEIIESGEVIAFDAEDTRSGLDQGQSGRGFVNAILSRKFFKANIPMAQMQFGKVDIGSNYFKYLDCVRPNDYKATCTMAFNDLDAGEYELQLDITDNAHNHTVHNFSFAIVSHLSIIDDAGPVTHQIFVESPNDNTNTRRSIIEVSGYIQSIDDTHQLILSAQLFQAKICVREIINDAVSPHCINEEHGLVDLKGHFTIHAILPNPETKSIHYVIDIWASNGAQKTDVVRRNILLDGGNIITSAVAHNTFDGFTSETVVEDFLNGKTDIDHLHNALFSFEVAEGTEGLEIDFDPKNNLRDLPIIPNTSQYDTRIASLNATPDGVNQDETFKKDLTNRAEPQQSINWLNTSQPCVPSTHQSLNPHARPTQPNHCLWQFSYAIPKTLGGGVYEIRIRVYKLSSVEEMTIPLIVDGQILSEPVILRAEKTQQSDSKIVRMLDLSQGRSFYTNSRKLLLKGAVDPTAWIKMRIFDKNDIEIQKELFQSARTGLWQTNVVLPDNEQIYKVELTALSSDFGNQNHQSSSVKSYITLDRTPPDLQYVVTKVDSNNVNPWIAEGRSHVTFDVMANESLSRSFTFKSDGYKAEAYPSSFEVTKACGILNYNSESDQTFYTQPDKNTRSYVKAIHRGDAVTQNCKNSFWQSSERYSELNFDASQNGVITPNILLEDLAGNQVIFSNDTQFTTKKQNGDWVVPFRAIAKGTFRQIINPNDDSVVHGLIRQVNGQKIQVSDPLPDQYPYSRKGRGRSLDFRLFSDNDRPLYQDWYQLDRDHWAKRPDGVGADGIYPELDRVMNDPSIFSVKNPKSVLSAHQVSTISQDELNDFQRVVIRGNHIQLTGFTEQNQRVRIFLEHYKLLPSSTNRDEKTIDTTYNDLQTDCNIHPPSQKTKIPKFTKSDGLITNFNNYCKFTYDFTFDDDGLSPGGVSQNLYQIAYYPIDLAGNTPSGITIGPLIIGQTQKIQVSSTLLVFHDTERPPNSSIINIKSRSYNPVLKSS